MYRSIRKNAPNRKVVIVIFLLSNRNKDKLLIIYLLSYPNWTTDKLALKLNRSKRHTKDLLRELKEDLVYHLNATINIKIEFSGKILVMPSNSEEILHLFYSLKLAYLEQTNEFKLLHLFLQKPFLSIEFISSSLFLSYSYTRKIIKKTNVYLFPFRFQISEEKNVYVLKGNELFIRLFLYILMNDTYKSIPWAYIKQDIPNHISHQQSLHIMLSILNSRKGQNDIIPELSQKSAWIISNLKETYNFISYLKSKNSYYQDSLDQVAIEEYFIFFTHICAPQAIPKEVKIVLGEKFLKAPDDIIFSRSLSHKIIERFQLDYQEEKKYLLAYYLTILECFYEIMQETTILFEELIFPPPQYSLLFEKKQVKEILQFFQNFLFEKSHTDLLDNYKLQQYFCGLIYTILQIETPPVVRIFLYITNGLVAQDLVQTRLETIYNSKTILFVFCFEQADLIVTDSLNFDQEAKLEIFYFNTILKEDQWSLLLQKINQLILIKITTRERDSY